MDYLIVALLFGGAVFFLLTAVFCDEVSWCAAGVM